jgi:hypothetical protein
MKVGDKIRIVETGRVGWIIGQNALSWKIDFLDGEKPEMVLKTVNMVLAKDPVKPNGKPNPRPKKRWGWKRWLWTIGLILVIGGAVALTLYNVLQ